MAIVATTEKFVDLWSQIGTITRDEKNPVQSEILLLAYKLLHSTLEISWTASSDHNENIA